MADRRLDPGSLGAGLAVVALGVALLLDRTEVLDLRFAGLLPVLCAALGAALLAIGLAGRR